ncbi:unnamed protein product, partial [Ascophyllum nodosum]
QDHLNYSSLPPGRPSRSMIYLVKGVVTTVTWLSIISEVSSDELYEKVVPADTADCLKKVVALSLSNYEITYDRVKGRRYLGPLGLGLKHVIPESVEVHPRNTYPSPIKGEPPVVIENQAIVDKTAIFMNNVGATQELARRNEEMWRLLQEQMEFDADMVLAIESVEEKLNDEQDAQLLERKRFMEAEAEQTRLMVELERLKADEIQKNVEEELNKQRQESEHNLRVEKRRLAAEAESQKAATSEVLRMQEESAQRREALRLEADAERRTQNMDFERELEAAKLEMDKERVKAEVVAKVNVERENEDMLLRQIRVQGEEDRKRSIEVINTVLAHLTSGAVAVISKPRRTLLLSSWLLGLAATYLVLREASVIFGQVIEKYLGKPSLVRETSRSGMFASALNAFRCGVKWTLLPATRSDRNRTRISPKEELPLGRHQVVRAFQDVVLPLDLKEQILSLAVAIRNSKKNNAPYRHLLLYGPPGTGKTMVAKRLAAYSGMDCAVMSGGDVGPLGKDAVTELHGLFRWAARSPRGLLLFIDEAEAFLGRRSSPGMSEDTRNALNALLYHTGSASQSLMMVLSTNRAEDLDEAVLDRMDDSLFFPLPDKKARAHLLAQYFHKYFTAQLSSTSTKGASPGTNGGGSWRKFLALFEEVPTARKVLSSKVDENFIRGFADDIHGFSGREVSKLLLSVHSCVHGSQDDEVTTDMIKKLVYHKAREHSTKQHMRKTTSGQI